MRLTIRTTQRHTLQSLSRPQHVADEQMLRSWGTKSWEKIHLALPVLNMVHTYAFQNGCDHVDFWRSLSGFGPNPSTMLRIDWWLDFRTGALHGRMRYFWISSAGIWNAKIDFFLLSQMRYFWSKICFFWSKMGCFWSKMDCFWSKISFFCPNLVFFGPKCVFYENVENVSIPDSDRGHFFTPLRVRDPSKNL